MNANIRTEINRALAKAIAYKACGKQADAEAWAAQLVRLLECLHQERFGAEFEPNKASPVW